MNPQLWQAVQQGLTCDITTIGRKSGQPRRIEIWYFVIEGQVYLSGTPGSRDWYANLVEHPACTFHVKEGAYADLPASARPITDTATRRRIMQQIMEGNSYFRGGDLNEWIERSPLVQIVFGDV